MGIETLNYLPPQIRCFPLLDILLASPTWKGRAGQGKAGPPGAGDVGWLSALIYDGVLLHCLAARVKPRPVVRQTSAVQHFIPTLTTQYLQYTYNIPNTNNTISKN